MATAATTSAIRPVLDMAAAKYGNRLPALGAPAPRPALVFVCNP
jgi:hypothetical protein